MALTAAESIDVRRFCGYPSSGAASFQTLATQANSTELDTVLSTLSAEMEVIVRAYLTNLRSLDAAYVGAGIGDTDSLDTKKAAVWERNPNELLERNALFTAWRYRLCQDLGVPAGPGIVVPLMGIGGGDAALPPAVLVV
jgi:hypothetical protein